MPTKKEGRSPCYLYVLLKGKLSYIQPSNAVDNVHPRLTLADARLRSSPLSSRHRRVQQSRHHFPRRAFLLRSSEIALPDLKGGNETEHDRGGEKGCVRLTLKISSGNNGRAKLMEHRCLAESVSCIDLPTLDQNASAAREGLRLFPL